MGMIDGAVKGLNDLDTLIPVELGQRHPTYDHTCDIHATFVSFIELLGWCRECGNNAHPTNLIEFMILGVI